MPQITELLRLIFLIVSLQLMVSTVCWLPWRQSDIDYWLTVEVVQCIHQSAHCHHRRATVFQPASSVAKLNYPVSVDGSWYRKHIRKYCVPSPLDPSSQKVRCDSVHLYANSNACWDRLVDTAIVTSLLCSYLNVVSPCMWWVVRISKCVLLM